MAKFYMEDGSIKSGDRIMDELIKKTIRSSIKDRKYMDEPRGDNNTERLSNISIYDLICQISDNTDQCIIDSITGGHHELCSIAKDCHHCILCWLESDKW